MPTTAGYLGQSGTTGQVDYENLRNWATRVWNLSQPSRSLEHMFEGERTLAAVMEWERLPEGFADMAPGPDLARALDAVDCDRLSGFDRVEVMRANARMVAHFQAGLFAPSTRSTPTRSRIPRASTPCPDPWSTTSPVPDFRLPSLSPGAPPTRTWAWPMTSVSDCRSHGNHFVGETSIWPKPG